jgi:hypothetical protein
MRWTLKDIERLKAAGKIRDYRVTNISKNGNKVPKSETKGAKSETKMPKMEISEPKAISHIKQVLYLAGIAYVTEHRFHPTRKWRFDIAIPSLMVAIEYEGLAFKKTGHTTSEGYTNNCDKYNTATNMGWKVYRYTFTNYKEFSIELLK